MSSIDELKQELDVLPAKIGQARNTMEQRKRSAESELSYERYFSSRESLSSQLASAYEAKSVWTLHNLLPAQERDTFLKKIQDTPLPIGFRTMPGLESTNPSDIATATSMPEIAKPIPSDFVHIATPSTPEACIESIEDMRGALADLGMAVESQNRRLEPLRAKAQELAGEKYMLQKKHAPLSATLANLEKDIRGYSKIAEEALHNQYVYAQNTLKHAATALVWDYVYEKVVKPELIAILEKNNLPTGIEVVEVLNKIRETPEDLIPRLGPLRDMPRLISTMRLVASIETEFEDWATRAAEALAQPGNQSAQLLSKELFPYVDKKGLEIMKTASDTMDGAAGRLAQLIIEPVGNN